MNTQHTERPQRGQMMNEIQDLDNALDNLEMAQRVLDRAKAGVEKAEKDLQDCTNKARLVFRTTLGTNGAKAIKGSRIYRLTDENNLAWEEFHGCIFAAGRADLTAERSDGRLLCGRGMDAGPNQQRAAAGHG